MAGRPTEKTPDVIRKIEEAAALDCTVEEMSFYAGIHRATLYRWLEESSEFKDRIEELRQKPFLLARQTINKAIKDNPQYAFEYMKRKKPKEFGDNIKSTVEIKSADGLLKDIFKEDDEINE